MRWFKLGMGYGLCDKKGMRTSADLNSNYQGYHAQLFGKSLGAIFEISKDKAQDLGKDGISLSASEGQILQFFVKAFGCKKFVEIGTLTGYSALWIATAMEEGELFTLEKNETHAKAAEDVFSAFKTKVKISLLLGEAEEQLRHLSPKGPFDGIFIDGNKSAYVHYLNWAESHLKSGALIVADNVFLGGAVWGEVNSRFSKKQVAVLQEFNERLANPEKYDSCLIPTSEGLFVARLK